MVMPFLVDSWRSPRPPCDNSSKNQHSTRFYFNLPTLPTPEPPTPVGHFVPELVAGAEPEESGRGANGAGGAGDAGFGHLIWQLGRRDPGGRWNVMLMIGRMFS